MQPLNPNTTRPTAAGLRRAGSALLITLAFVLLLSVLIVGFMSRVLLAHRISVSSAGQVKADVFAQGVSAQLIGDLEQEIQNNSVVITSATKWGASGSQTSWGTTLYYPNSPRYMVPVYDYPGAPTSTVTPTIANLLKVSNPNAVQGFPASCGTLTTVAALNGRAVSLNRWAETEMVDPTVYAANATTPAWIPSWVVVKRDGTTATTWNSNLTYSHTGTGSVTTTVIGRYAYAIYDEGGLLDANVAGRPFSTGTTAPTGTGAEPYPALTAYPIGEAYADLTQLSTAATGTLFTGQQVDTLIGWRNNASINPTGANSFTTSLNAPTGTATTYTFTPANLAPANVTNYFNYLTSLNTGNLTTGTAVVQNGTAYATDSAFTSRQQLIGFMQQLLGPVNGPAAMQYLTHFSRTLNQPSYVPPINDPTVTNYPFVTTALLPYTTAGTGPDSSSNTAGGQDASINPPFLGVRVTGTFTRNDGSLAQIGEPLVKKRFDLNRLVWVTYNGPIWSGSSYNVATSYINALKNTYGFTDAYLQQGTAANVYKYFGLSWVSDDPSVRVDPGGDGQKKWVYMHNIATGPYTDPGGLYSANSDGSNNGGFSIKHLPSLAGTREPDFFELLKAGIAAGSKAKAATWENGYKNLADPSPYQNTLDISLDAAIIQLGANIVDEYSLDGFPQRVLYCDGTTYGSASFPVYREYDGCENLPYFYRSRNCCVVGRPPAYNAATYHDSATDVPGTITDTGYGIFLEMPEVWNPYDPYSPRCATDSNGNLLSDGTNPLCPTAFRIVVDSIDPDHLAPLGSSYATVAGSYSSVAGSDFFASGAYGYIQNSTQVDSTATYSVSSLPFATSGTITAAMQMASPSFYHYSENSGIFFYVNESTTANAVDFFREPTLLCSASAQSGSNIQAFGANNIMAGAAPPSNTAIVNMKTAGLLQAGGAVSSYDGNNYLGMFMSVIPIDFGCVTSAGKGSSYATDFQTTQGTDRAVTFRVQYYSQSPSSNAAFDSTSTLWANYDTKYVNLLETHDSEFHLTNLPYNGLEQSYYSVCYDPRTSRFGFPFGGSEAGGTGYGAPTPPAPGSPCYGTYSALANTYGWTDATNRELVSERPDYSMGLFLEAYGVGGEEGPDLYPQNEPGLCSDESSSLIGGATNINWKPTSTEPPDWRLGHNTTGGTSFIPFGVIAQNFATFPSSYFSSYATAIAQGATPSSATMPHPYSSFPFQPTSGSAVYYSDPDHVVRRGVASYMKSGSNVGQPMAVAFPGSFTNATSQLLSRPIVLNRPFRNAAEMGYAFSGTPWKNIDFSHPESGDSALLDIFTVGDTPDPGGLIAGRVNLNTQQPQVLQALLAGTYKDEENNYLQSLQPTWAVPPITSTEAAAIAAVQTARTVSTNPTTGQGPLRNVSELVGRYVSAVSAAGGSDTTNYDGAASFTGLSGDSNLSAAFSDAGGSGVSSYTSAIPRLRESVIRALSAGGQTRTWNLLIDVVAQTGEYPSTATNFSQFAVQGEQRYWIHLAIDRFTGQVIDKQIEVIKE